MTSLRSPIAVAAGITLVLWCSLAARAQTDTAPLPPVRPEIGGDHTVGRPVTPSSGTRITAGPQADPEDAAGIPLTLGGRSGEILLRVDGTFTATAIRLEGRDLADADGTCAVEIVGDAGVPLRPMGRPEGLLRFQLESSACPLVIDILHEAILVDGPDECTFAEAACVIDARGLWTPPPQRTAEGARLSAALLAAGTAAEADNAAALTARGAPARPRRLPHIDCGAFPEEAVDFCEARLAVARAASLAVRLGLFPDAPQPGPVDRIPPPPLDILPRR